MAFNFIKEFFGSVSVEEKNGKITVSAVKSKDTLADLYAMWRTSRIELSMFTKVTPYTLEFYSFFAVEFTYMLNKLIEQPGRGSTSKRTMKNVLQGMLENTWLQNTQIEHEPFLNRSKLNLFSKTPLKHQTDFFNHYEKITPQFLLNGYTMGMGTGTGKTLTALALCEMLDVDVTIIVSLKASIYRVWEDAMLNDFKKSPVYWIFDRDRNLPQKLPQYLIFHMESLGELEKISPKLAGKKVGLILDESHKLNELTAGRTQQILKVAQRLKPVTTLWASATPIKAYGAEAIPMLMTYDPFMTPEVADAFTKLYGKSSKKCFDIISHRLGNVIFQVNIIKSSPIFETVKVKIKKPERFLLTTLKQDMKDFIAERIKYWTKLKPQAEDCRKTVWRIVENTRETKEEVEKFKIYKRCFEGISRTTDYAAVKEEMAICNKYEKEIIDPLLSPALRKEWRSYKSVLKYLPLKVRGECLGNVVSKRREEVTVAMIEAIDIPKYIKEAEKKTILFTSYVEAVEVANTYLKGKGFNPVTVHGQNGEDLTSQVKKFYEGSANPLIATFQSLSTSVPLVIANTILALNVPFRDYIFEQAVGRIDRINQDTQTYVYKFVLDTGDEPNISTRTLDILEWSAEQVDQMLGVTEPIALESLQHDLGHFRWHSDGWGTTDAVWVDPYEDEDDLEGILDE